MSKEAHMIRALIQGDLSLHASGQELYSDAELKVITAAADELDRLCEGLRKIEVDGGIHGGAWCSAQARELLK